MSTCFYVIQTSGFMNGEKSTNSKSEQMKTVENKRDFFELWHFEKRKTNAAGEVELIYWMHRNSLLFTKQTFRLSQMIFFSNLFYFNLDLALKSFISKFYHSMILTWLHLHLVQICVSSPHWAAIAISSDCGVTLTSPPLICAGPPKKKATKKIEEE